MRLGLLEMCRIGRVIFWGVLVLVASGPPATAQVFELHGGSSSLFETHGASVEIHGERYDARVGFGLANKPRLGFYLENSYHGYSLGFGDQSIPFLLPTDLFDRSYYFLGRGVSARRKSENGALFLYAGATSSGISTPFFNAAPADSPTGLLFYERRIFPAVRFYSHNVLSSRQSFIQGIEWSAQEKLKLATAAGIGNNRSYWASSVDFDRGWIALKASYAHADRMFRRISVKAPMLAESDRENLRLELTPVHNLRLGVYRQNFLLPVSESRDFPRAAITGCSLTANVWGLALNGSIFNSETQAGVSRGILIGARRTLAGPVEASMQFLGNVPAGGHRAETLVIALRETLSPRLTLSQTVTRGIGQTSIAFGGTIISNFLTAGIDYQTVLLPFAQPGQPQLRQVLVMNLGVRLPGNLEISGATHVTPLGDVRYTIQAHAFAYRGSGSNQPGSTRTSGFAKYIVRGKTIDEEGRPVSGAALHVDGELVFTDSQGEFFLRRKRAREYRLEILLDQFLLPGKFDLISAPSTVVAAPEETARPYRIILQRQPP